MPPSVETKTIPSSSSSRKNENNTNNNPITPSTSDEMINSLGATFTNIDVSSPNESHFSESEDGRNIFSPLKDVVSRGESPSSSLSAGGSVGVSGRISNTFPISTDSNPIPFGRDMMLGNRAIEGPSTTTISLNSNNMPSFFQTQQTNAIESTSSGAVIRQSIQRHQPPTERDDRKEKSISRTHYKGNTDAFLNHSPSHVLGEDLLKLNFAHNHSSNSPQGDSFNNHSGNRTKSLIDGRTDVVINGVRTAETAPNNSLYGIISRSSPSTQVVYHEDKDHSRNNLTGEASARPASFSPARCPPNDQIFPQQQHQFQRGNGFEHKAASKSHFPVTHHMTENHLKNNWRTTAAHRNPDAKNNLQMVEHPRNKEHIFPCSDGIHIQDRVVWKGGHVDDNKINSARKHGDISYYKKPASVGNDISLVNGFHQVKSPSLQPNGMDHRSSLGNQVPVRQAHPPFQPVVPQYEYHRNIGSNAQHFSTSPNHSQDVGTPNNSRRRNYCGNKSVKNLSYHPNVTPTSDVNSVAPGKHSQQQILYMAVPMQNGQGQMLQPVQMVHLPNGQSTFVVPAQRHPVVSKSSSFPVSMADGRSMNQPQQHNHNHNHNQRIVHNSLGIRDEKVNCLNYNKSLVDQGAAQAAHGVSGYPTVAQANSLTYSYPNEGNKKREKRNKPKANKLQENDAIGDAQECHFSSNKDPVLLNSFHVQAPFKDDNSNIHGLFNDISVEPSEAITALYHSTHRPPLSSLLGHVHRLSRDQVGCRLLQQSLDEDGPQAATTILHESLPFLAETMTDPFGNYLFQKILEKISVKERLLLVKTVSPRLVNAALNLHGTRSVQKVVEMSIADDVSPADRNAAAEVVTKALTPAAARLCIDSHGNHVIQRILQRLPHRYSKFVFDAVANSVGDVARHRHGCCVIQRCLDSPPSPARSNLVRRIVEKALDLMQDAYGNYVVQYVLDVCGDEEASAVCESVVGKVGLLAIQKFSSNVMEKCLERSGDWVQELYLRELSVPDKIRELMADPFGNYVVQRALSVATHSQAVRLVETMRPYLPGMRNTAGGRRIVAKICRRFPNFNLNLVAEQQMQASFSQQEFNYHRPIGSVTMGYVNGSSGPVVGMMHVNGPKGPGGVNDNGNYHARP